MKKIVSFLAVLLLAGGAVVVVLTYAGANVAGLTKIKIVSSDEALLALMGPEDEVCMEYCSMDGGTLALDFTRPGFMPDSSYEFDRLFIVKNNSAASIMFTVENGGVPYVKTIRPCGSGQCFVADGSYQDYWRRLEPGSSEGITVCFDTEGAKTGTGAKGTLWVRADAAQ